MIVRHLLLLLLITITSAHASAQAPALMNYQAAARDGGGVLLVSTALTVRFTVRTGSANGTNVYRETHGVTTNAYGVFNAQVGGGTVVSGSFAGIDWGGNSHWLQVEVNPGGGYVDLGAEQMVSVPYAKYAESSGGGSSGWGLTGNSGTDPTTDFIGTNDAQPLVFKVNGVEAGRIGLIGSGNTSLGASSLAANTTGTSNTAMGSGALQFNSSGEHNTAVGTGALYVNTASGNTAIGSLALAANGSGVGNTAVGNSTLFTNTTGYGNSALGDHALEFNNGDQNTAIGSEALRINSTGQGNCAIGSLSLRYNSTGSQNTGIGRYALLNNSIGADNVAIGVQSQYQNTTGTFNTTIGNFALTNNLIGDDNVSVGWGSGTTSSFTNTINIGNYGYLNAFGNQAFIGNLSTIWNGGNVTWSTYSDERVKTDVRDDVHGLDFITRLRPITYHRDIDRQAELTGNKPTRDFPEKYDIERIKFSGFLAQQVEHAAQEVGYEFSGVTPPPNDNQLYTVSYEQFVVPLVKAVQEQQDMILELQAEVEALRQLLGTMKNGKP